MIYTGKQIHKGVMNTCAASDEFKEVLNRKYADAEVLNKKLLSLTNGSYDEYSMREKILEIQQELTK